MRFTRNDSAPVSPRARRQVAVACTAAGLAFLAVGLSLVGLDLLYRVQGQQGLASVTASELGGGRRIHYVFTTQSGTTQSGSEMRRNDPVGTRMPVEYLPRWPGFNRIVGQRDR